MRNVEIERKWLMDGFPDLPHLGEELMEQAYLAMGDVTVRIRQIITASGSHCVLTIKGGGGLRRTEVEVPLEPDQYRALLPHAAVPAVCKRLRRYALPGGRVLECSLVDEGDPEAFYYAEVEFEDEQAARAFIAPPCLGREVTEEPGWTMAAYARRKAEKRGSAW